MPCPRGRKRVSEQEGATTQRCEDNLMLMSYVAEVEVGLLGGLGGGKGEDWGKSEGGMGV